MEWRFILPLEESFITLKYTKVQGLLHSVFRESLLQLILQASSDHSLFRIPASVVILTEPGFRQLEKDALRTCFWWTYSNGDGHVFIVILFPSQHTAFSPVLPQLQREQMRQSFSPLLPIFNEMNQKRLTKQNKKKPQQDWGWCHSYFILPLFHPTSPPLNQEELVNSLVGHLHDQK